MGKRRLEDALQQIDTPIEVVYRCFELDPTVERDVNYNIYEKLSSKYGMSIEEAKGNVQNMVQMAKDAGIDFQMDTLVLTNTFDAHRLTLLAKEKGLMKEMTDRILRAHFTESKHIGNHETLADLAVDVGLDRGEAIQLLQSDTMSEEVQKDKQEAARLGINSVPFFLIDKKYAITGAQSTEVFVESLKKVINESGDSKRLI